MFSHSGSSILLVIMLISALAWHAATARFRLALFGSILTTVACVVVIRGFETSWNYRESFPQMDAESLFGILMFVGIQGLLYVITRKLVQFDRREDPANGLPNKRD
jgi:hypothetical protein